MIKELAPLTPSSPPLHGANTGRWRVVVGCLSLTLLGHTFPASPAFSYSDKLDSYLASKFQLVADDHRQQYIRPSGLPEGMLRYYDPHPWGQKPHPFSSYCCNQQDCGFAKPGSVTWTPEGYRVRMPDGHFQIVPEDSPAVRPVYEKGHEKEARFGACILPKGAAIDAYLENLSPGSLESPSAYYVRCLYIGRSGQ